MMQTIQDKEAFIFNPPDLGCALYLPGLPGGGLKIHDRSPHGNHGTITGATWRSIGGVWGLGFNSDDKVTIANSPVFTTGSQLSVFAWIKNAAAISSTSVLACVYAGPTDENRSWNWYVYPGEEMRLDLANGLGKFSKRTYTDSLSGLTGYNQLGFTMNGTSVRFYQNGSPISTYGTGVASLYPSTEVLSIGHYPWDAGFYNGEMYLFMLFNTTLTAIQVARLYNQTRHLF